MYANQNNFSPGLLSGPKLFLSRSLPGFATKIILVPVLSRLWDQVSFSPGPGPEIAESRSQTTIAGPAEPCLSPSYFQNTPICFLQVLFSINDRLGLMDGTLWEKGTARVLGLKLSADFSWKYKTAKTIKKF